MEKRESGNERDRLFIRRSYVVVLWRSYRPDVKGEEKRGYNYLLHTGEYPNTPQMRPPFSAHGPKTNPFDFIHCIFEPSSKPRKERLVVR